MVNVGTSRHATGPTRLTKWRQDSTVPSDNAEKPRGGCVCLADTHILNAALTSVVPVRDDAHGSE
jgi:hypothetical protein